MLYIHEIENERIGHIPINVPSKCAGSTQKHSHSTLYPVFPLPVPCSPAAVLLLFVVLNNAIAAKC